MKVIIEVTGGVAYVVKKPEGVELVIIDNDNPSKETYSANEEVTPK